MKLTIVEKNLVSWTAMHIDFAMCKKGDPLGFLKIQLVAGCNVSNFGYSVLAQMGALFEPPLPPW